LGTVEVKRWAYEARGVDALYPADAALNLPDDLYSFGVRRLVAEEACKVSFGAVVEQTKKILGIAVPKRQVEELTVRAARDFAAFYATREVVAPIAEAGFQVMFHTFAALPSACAAADAVLGILEHERLVERAQTMGARLSNQLHARLGQHPHVAEIRGLGLLQAIEIVADRDTLTPFDEAKNVTNRVVGKALNHGVFFYPGGTGVVRDIITLGPPLISTEAEIDLMAEVLETAINEALG